MRRFLDAPQRPSQPSQRDDLLFLFFAQDIAHVTERNLSASSMSRFSYLRWPVFRCPPMAGFGCPPRIESSGLRQELEAQANWSLDHFTFADASSTDATDFGTTVSSALNPLFFVGKCAAPACRVRSTNGFVQTVGLYCNFALALIRSRDISFRKSASPLRAAGICLPLLRWLNNWHL